MTENAPNAEQSLLSQALQAQERSPFANRPASKVVSLPVVVADPAVNFPSVNVQGRDLSSAVNLINEAREAIRIGEDRSRQLEQELKQVLQEASAEIKALKTQLQVGEHELAQARLQIADLERRVAEADKRANDAEAWLCRLHDVVVSSFGAIAKQGGAPALRPPRPVGAAG